MAAYSELDAARITRLEADYDLRIEAVAAIPQGMANSSFRAGTSAGELVVSILDNHDRASAERLVRITEAVRRQGVPTNEIVHRADGDLVSMMDGTPIVLRRWIPGVTHDLVPRRWIGAAGRLLARIHSCDPASVPAPVGIRRLIPPLREILADFPHQEHADWIRRRLDHLDTVLPPGDDPRQSLWTVIHGDFAGPNIVIGDSGDLHVLDWETAAIDDPVLDCGFPVLDMCRTGARLDRELIDAFAAGYSDVAPLDRELLMVGVEYAAVILSFHRYRRHHLRFPNPAGQHLFREMVELADTEFPR